jgi:hypothetical protein
MLLKWLIQSKKKNKDTIVYSIDVINWKMLLAEADSTWELVEMLLSWHIKDCYYI